MKHRYKIGAKITHPDFTSHGYVLVNQIFDTHYHGTYYSPNNNSYPTAILITRPGYETYI